MLNRRQDTNKLTDIEPVTKAIKNTGANIKYAAIFGSYPTGETDLFSDIDLLIVCENGSDKTTLQKQMQVLGRNMGREIHLNQYVSDEFESRLRYHDYKLASILQDASVLINDGSHEEKLDQLKRRIGEDSIRFNEIKGVKTLRKATENLEKYKHRISLSKSPLENSSSPSYFQNLCIRYSHMALGYLYASHMMRQTGRTVTLEPLLKRTPFLGELIQADDTSKRMGYISAEKTEEYVQNVISEFARFPPSALAMSIHLPNSTSS